MAKDWHFTNYGITTLLATTFTASVAKNPIGPKREDAADAIDYPV